MSRDSHKKCPKNAEKGRKISEFVPNFIRSVHYFNRLLTGGQAVAKELQKLNKKNGDSWQVITVFA